MRISDWSSDVCSSDLRGARRPTIITKASPPFSIGVRLVSKDDEPALMDAAPVSAGRLLGLAGPDRCGGKQRLEPSSGPANAFHGHRDRHRTSALNPVQLPTCGPKLGSG